MFSTFIETLMLVFATVGVTVVAGLIYVFIFNFRVQREIEREHRERAERVLRNRARN